MIDFDGFIFRKWKELVDEWVKSNTPNGDCGGDGGSGGASTLIGNFINLLYTIEINFPEN